MEKEKPTLGHSDIEYVADMLAAILWIQNDFAASSRDLIPELDQSLRQAETVLRKLSRDLQRASN